MERALRFLKSTSVNCGAPEDGAGVTEADNGGVVPAGDAAGGDPRVGEQKRVAILPARTQANKSTDRKPKRAEYS